MEMKIRKTALVFMACGGLALLCGCGNEYKRTFEQAERDLEAGSYEYALEGYRVCVENDVRVPYSYRGSGIASLRMGDYQSAIDSFTKALDGEKLPKSLKRDLLSYRATAQLHAGLYDGAMADCQTLVSGYEMDAETYFLTGKTALLLDSYDEAASNFQKAFGEDPTYERAIQIYDAYLDRDMEADGTRYLEAALSGEAKNAKDHCDRGRVYYYMEDYVNAREELTTASNGGSTEAFLLLGMVYMAQKDVSNARVMYQEYVDRAPGGSKEEGVYSAAKGYNGLALCDMAEGNYDGALANISTGISAALGEDLKSLLFNEIAAYEKKLDFATALTKAQAYLEMYPGDKDGEKELAFLKTRTADLESEAETPAEGEIPEEGQEAAAP